MTRTALLAPLLAIAASVAQAETLANPHDCRFVLRCDQGEACTPDETAFTLAIRGTTLDFGMDGHHWHVAYDPALRTASFDWGGEVVQLRLTGETRGIAVISATEGEAAAAHLMRLECQPA